VEKHLSAFEVTDFDQTLVDVVGQSGGGGYGAKNSDEGYFR
jgi:hypothetical protein